MTFKHPCKHKLKSQKGLTPSTTQPPKCKDAPVNLRLIQFSLHALVSFPHFFSWGAFPILEEILQINNVEGYECSGLFLPHIERYELLFSQ